MKTVNDRIPVAVTLLILLAVPLGLFGYKHVYLPHKHPDARIITLTALATDGVWTQEEVQGLNYWRKHFSATPEILVKQGETIVLRLASADVLHSFSIPLLNIGPLDVPAGEVREVRFKAEKPDTLVFLCWQVCSPVHGKLRGTIVVLGPDGKPATEAPGQELDLEGHPDHATHPAPSRSLQEPDLQ